MFLKYFLVLFLLSQELHFVDLYNCFLHKFHKKFLQFGIVLYLMVMLVQYLLGSEAYILLLNNPLVQLLLHGIIIINTGFLLSGEKYYNENVGAE